MAWPPTFDELLLELGPAYDTPDQADEQRLRTVLHAAVAFVEHVHQKSYDFQGDLLSDKPPPPDTVELGTLRLAIRWHTRRRSPEALLTMGELGSTKVPSFDPDIERLLGIGKYRKAVFA